MGVNVLSKFFVLTFLCFQRQFNQILFAYISYSQVKNLITARRVTVVNVCIFLILIAGQSPVYVVNRLDWKFFPDVNKTLIGIVHASNHEIIDSITYVINHVLFNFCAFFVIIVCTLTLSIQLHNQAKWRAGSTKDNSLSNQNKTAAKLVVVVSVIFIVCFIPNCFLFILISSSVDFSVKGKYRFVTFILGGVGVILESINSAVNIFVYYGMSTKYRIAFRKTFFHVKQHIP